MHFLTTQYEDGFYIIEASFLQRFHDASFDHSKMVKNKDMQFFKKKSKQASKRDRTLVKKLL